MLRSSLFSSSALALLCVTASAQSTLTPQKITAPIKDRGTYHLSTGTWSRANSAVNFNSEVLFSNTAPTGYFFGTQGGWNTIDHGRIPSDTSPTSPTSVTGNANKYIIDCFELGYCSNSTVLQGGADFLIQFYEDYAPCTDPDLTGGIPVVAAFFGTGLPGGTPASGQGCWIVGFDLANSTTTFSLTGDADGSWDNLANADSFGWGLDWTNANTPNGTGSFMAGNCPIGAGGTTVPQHGFGTKFGGTVGAQDTTGLGTNDFFWIDAAAVAPPGQTNGGCFFFGGCTGPTGGASFNPYGGFWLQLFGTKGGTPLSTDYCTSFVNASGSRATMNTDGTTDVNVDLVLRVEGIPNSTGQLFFGTMGAPGTGMAMLGDGPLCAVMSIVRMNPFLGAGMMMQPANGVFLNVNYSAAYGSSLTGTRHFQHWFRSTLSTGEGSNGSSGVSITF